MSKEFLVWQNVLGGYLRTARLSAGLSLREIESESGVARSEIQRLESGSQDFRLVSFLKLCAALGLPPSSVLDQVITCDPNYYAALVALDPFFKAELADVSIEAGSQKAELYSLYIGSLAAAAAQLLRCSNPPLRASLARYPNGKMQAAYIDFSRKIDFEMEQLDRLGIIRALKGSPISELKNQGLWNKEYLLAPLDKVKKTTRHPIWILFPGTETAQSHSDRGVALSARGTDTHEGLERVVLYNTRPETNVASPPSGISARPSAAAKVAGKTMRAGRDKGSTPAKGTAK